MRAGYRIAYNGYYLQIVNQATRKMRPCIMKDAVHKLPVELWNVYTMFDRGGKFINHPTNLPTIPQTQLSINYLKKEKKLLLIKTPFLVYST